MTSLRLVFVRDIVPTAVRHSDEGHAPVRRMHPRSWPPAVLIGGYVALHLALGGLDALVFSPVGVEAGVVLPAFAVLLAVLALGRRDDVRTASVLAGVAVAAASLSSLLLQFASGAPPGLTLAGLLVGWVQIPPLLGLAAGLNTAAVVWAVRRIQRAMA